MLKLKPDVIECSIEELLSCVLPNKLQPLNGALAHGQLRLLLDILKDIKHKPLVHNDLSLYAVLYSTFDISKCEINYDLLCEAIEDQGMHRHFRFKNKLK